MQSFDWENLFMGYASTFDWGVVFFPLLLFMHTIAVSGPIGKWKLTWHLGQVCLVDLAAEFPPNWTNTCNRMHAVVCFLD